MPICKNKRKGRLGTLDNFKRLETTIKYFFEFPKSFPLVFVRWHEAFCMKKIRMHSACTCSDNWVCDGRLEERLRNFAIAKKIMTYIYGTVRFPEVAALLRAGSPSLILKNGGCTTRLYTVHINRFEGCYNKLVRCEQWNK